MIGPGAARMGGAGVRPRVPPTAMAGAPAGGGAPGLGLKKGGHVSKDKKEEMREKKEKRHEKLAKGGIVGGSDAKGRERHSGKAE